MYIGSLFFQPLKKIFKLKKKNGFFKTDSIYLSRIIQKKIYIYETFVQRLFKKDWKTKQKQFQTNNTPFGLLDFASSRALLDLILNLTHKGVSFACLSPFKLEGCKCGFC